MSFLGGILGIAGKVASVATGNPLFAVGGDFLSGSLGQSETNQTNLDIANANNATSIELANTAYQRRVKDLSAAGLNPMLAYTQGGAQVPSLTTPTMGNTVSAGQNSMLNSAVMAKTQAETNAANTSADLNKAAVAKTNQETLLTAANARSAATSADEAQYMRDAGVWTTKVGQLINSSNLTGAQKALVEEEIRNAIATRSKINAETGNIAVDTLLKQAQRTQYETETERTRQEINFNVLDTPRRQSEGDFWRSNYGREMAPYVNSAKGVSSLIQGNVLKDYHSR